MYYKNKYFLKLINTYFFIHLLGLTVYTTSIIHRVPRSNHMNKTAKQYNNNYIRAPRSIIREQDNTIAGQNKYKSHFKSPLEKPALHNWFLKI